MNVDFRAVDVLDLLRSLGIRNVTVVGGRSGPQARYSCPFPGHSSGDSEPSAFMNIETTAWMCFSCKASGNAVTFLADFENVSPVVASRWLRQRYMGGFREPEGSIWEDLKSRLYKPLPTLDGLTAIDENAADAMRVRWQDAYKARVAGESVPEPLVYMFDRGFLWSTLQDHGFGFDQITQRVTFEVRDDLGRLVGFKGRAWSPSQWPKYLVIGDGPGESRYGFERYETSQVLYGLHSADRSSGELVLVEGELNCVMLRQMGIANTVGLSGSYVSKAQIRLLRASCDRVVLLFDADEAGRLAVFGDDRGSTGAKGAGKALEDVMPVRVCGKHDNDPAAILNARYWEQLISDAQPFVKLKIGATNDFHASNVMI